MKQKCDECGREFDTITKGSTDNCGPVCSQKRIFRNCSHEECKGTTTCLKYNQEKKLKKKDSTRKCRNCGKEKSHTINCHVIPESLEELRVGIITKGGMERFSIVKETSSLKQTRTKRGFFWCDDCETHPELGGIDNFFVPKIKSMIQKRLNKGLINKEIINLTSKDQDFDLFYKSVHSIAMRKNAFLNKKENLKQYTNIQIQLDYFEIPKQSVILPFSTRVDTENEIEIKDEYIKLVINFGKGHSLNIFLHNEDIL